MIIYYYVDWVVLLMRKCGGDGVVVLCGDGQAVGVDFFFGFVWKGDLGGTVWKDANGIVFVQYNGFCAQACLRHSAKRHCAGAVAPGACWQTRPCN